MSTKSTAARWFERLVENVRMRVYTTQQLSLSLIMERVARLGDIVFPWIVHVGETVAKHVNKLQITMLESMLLASLWFGVICVIVLLTLLLTW